MTGGNICLATPVQVNKVKGGRCKVSGDKSIDISLVPDAKVGEWLLCHGNLAINKISTEEAKNILGMIEQCQHQH